ncbi:hypothetical protein ACQ4PT_004144 [Festuca glaucescens]
MFMMGLCASCHAGMLREPAVAARGEVPGLLQAAEVVIAVPGEGQPAAVRATSGGAYTPDITTLATKRPRHPNPEPNTLHSTPTTHLICRQNPPPASVAKSVTDHTHSRARLGVAMAGIACPAYPWPQDASQRGPKVFMQSDCAACHSMLPYAGLREAAAAHGPLVAQAAEIVVAEEAQPPALARPLYGRAPDITTIATKIQDGLRCNLYSTGGDAVCQELKRKMAPPSSVWMQFAQPYLRPFQAA